MITLIFAQTYTAIAEITAYMYGGAVIPPRLFCCHMAQFFFHTVQIAKELREKKNPNTQITSSYSLINPQYLRT